MNIQTIKKIILPLMLVAISAAGCGYYNPNMMPAEQQGPPIKLHVPLWDNPTSEIRLATDIHNALQDWLIQSKRLQLTKSSVNSDYVLSGKVISVRYPGRSYTTTDQAQALKAILTVEYAVRDTSSNKVVWEAKRYSLEETYSLGSSSSDTDNNKKKALELIIDDLGENIYIRLYRAISRHQRSKK